jgi:hypothetical protein
VEDKIKLDVEIKTDTGVRLLKKEDLKPLCSEDEKLLLGDFKIQRSDPGTRVAFLPTFAQASWHFAKEEIVSTYLASKIPEIKGAITSDGAAWMYWHYNFNQKKLKVQRVVLLKPGDAEHEGNVQALALLLLEALKLARDWDLMEVIIWNPCKELQEAAHFVASGKDGLSMKLEERTSSSIPSLRMRDGSKEEVTWIANEYYAWC